MAGRWENQVFDICRDELGEEKFTKRLSKYNKSSGGGLGSKTRLAWETVKAKKAVSDDSEFLRRFNAVGGVGYAKIVSDERLPPNDFFVPGKRYRVRLRHCNLRSDDDASVCQREVAIKWCDQNEDGPLDFVFTSGRVSLAPNCKTFLEIMKLKSPQDVMNYCYRNPAFFFSYVDSMRRAPSSFANVHYYSQVTYELTPNGDGPTQMARFRLVPKTFEDEDESGLLDPADQRKPWDSGRRVADTHSKTYLRQEYLDRLEKSAVIYRLQIQIRNLQDSSHQAWNPQQMWNLQNCPWFDISEIKILTPLTLSTIRNTYFNITDKPSCLSFPQPSSIHDYKSYARVMCTVYTTNELKRRSEIKLQVDNSTKRRLSSSDGSSGGLAPTNRATRIIGICEGPRNESKPQVDVFVTLTGTTGRTSPKRLDDKVEQVELPNKDFVEYYRIETESVGNLLLLTIGIRHRHLTDDWYLRYATVSDENRETQLCFPCHNIIMCKVTLRPGEVSLPQLECHEILRQERLLELKEKQEDYNWLKVDGMPSQIKPTHAKKLPQNEQTKLEKYSMVPWDIDMTMAEVIRPVMKEAKSQMTGALSFNRMRSYDTTPTVRMSRVEAFRRQHSTPVAYKAATAARSRWKKLKHAIAFIAKVRLPDGPQGEMCRLCQDDKDFGRLFLIGSNPTILTRCTAIPDKLALQDSDLEKLMDRGKPLAQEIQAGHVYIADYAVLDGVPCVNADADHRYMCAPICLLYVNLAKELVPLAIQLQQQPGPNNPVWFPWDKGEGWMLAKLWVRCADFHHQLMVAHIMKTHVIMEPFAVGMMRQLSSTHPVYKLLKPHFRYIIPVNHLMRQKITNRCGAMDRWTSLGSLGFKTLVKRCFQDFRFDDLDLPADLVHRGVHDARLLPGFLFRDDAVALWNIFSGFILNVLTHFYASNDDVREDYELQNWMRDVYDNGFGGSDHHGLRPETHGSDHHGLRPETHGSDHHGLRPETHGSDHHGLRPEILTVSDLASIVTRIIFATSCLHNATTAEALDLYSFLPLVPAMMRQPPPTNKQQAGRELLVKTLPEQSAEAYYGSLAYVLALCRAEDSTLTSNQEVYFVEPDIKVMQEDFHNEMDKLSGQMTERNDLLGPYASYEMLLPEKIPNSPEAIPVCPSTETTAEGLEDMSSQFGRGGSKHSASGMDTHAAMPAMALPIYMQFARNMGGRSYLGRHLPMQAMWGRGLGDMRMGPLGRRYALTGAGGLAGGLQEMGFGGGYVV